MFDEHHEELLVASVECAVNQHRAVVFVVLAGVIQVEPLGHVEVELDRRAVPLAPEGGFETNAEGPSQPSVGQFNISK